MTSAEPYASYLHFAPEDNHASTSSLRFLRAGCPSLHPTNSVKALKVHNKESVKWKWKLCSLWEYKPTICSMSWLSICVCFICFTYAVAKMYYSWPSFSVIFIWFCFTFFAVAVWSRRWYEGQSWNCCHSFHVGQRNWWCTENCKCYLSTYLFFYLRIFLFTLSCFLCWIPWINNF